MASVRDGRIVITYRLLQDSEWPRAKAILESFGQQLTKEENSLLAVAEVDNEIIGILCFHPVMHGEPFWVDEMFRGKVDICKLQGELTSKLPKGLEYYAFTPNRVMRWIAGQCGMKQMPWDVWKGIV